MYADTLYEGGKSLEEKYALKGETGGSNLLESDNVFVGKNEFQSSSFYLTGLQTSDEDHCILVCGTKSGKIYKGLNPSNLTATAVFG